jgi:hypothetical protein
VKTVLSKILFSILLMLMAERARGIEGDAHTLLLLHFENSLTGANNEAPTQSSGVTFEPGVNGTAAYFSTNNQVFYLSANNLNSTNGTLEFWIKPRWSGNDGRGHFVLKFGSGGGMLFGKDGANTWRSILNRFGSAGKPEVGTGINVGSEWRSNEWHHAAFTWTAQSLKLYIDGNLRSQAQIAFLPLVNQSTLQLGADGTGSYLDAAIDELRISDVERTAQEVQQSFLADLVVTNLSIQPAATNLLQTWWYTPTLTATTGLGVLQIPPAAVAWTSSDTNVAVVDAAGKIVAQTAGTAVLTASLNGASATLTLTVTAPVRPPDIDSIDPVLATPAPGALYEVPVMVINYIPTHDGTNVDAAILGASSIANFKNKLTLFNKRVKFMLEEGSRYHGYHNSNALPSLGYRIVRIVSAYEIMPPGRPAGGTPPAYFPDYWQILGRFGAGTLVSNQNVKEIWLWGYHTAGIVPVESDMSSPATGDISNSFRDPTDLPIYDRTYVLYNYNSSRTQAEAVHNHGHQIESILSYVNNRQDGNTDLWWNKFCGRNADGSFQQGRCGNTHFPPNATNDYDYLNLTPVSSDCMDWTAEKSGQQTMVNANTWGTIPYQWPDNINPPQKTESQYYIFWMQNMPGYQNGIRYGTNVMANWWQFTADWDNAIAQRRGLYKPPTVKFLPGGTRSESGVFRSTLSGDAGFGYEIQASTDLLQWFAVTNTTNFDGSWPVQDPMLSPQRIYRARQLFQ